MIQVLSPEVAARIAAGEVVERPASVVKELAENALDAGATVIHIDLQDGGKRLIRSADNGEGILSAEVLLAFERHATSKIRSETDLESIRTLGFRGEALASIAAVSRLTLITRQREERAGTRVQMEGGQLIRQESAGAPQGTVISVQDLFFNVPARLKFLKAEATERNTVSALIGRYALAYPGVAFSLTHNGKELLRTHGRGDLREAVVAIYGKDTASALIEVASEDIPRPDLTAIGVRGYVGQPSLQRPNRNQITLFINGRWVQDASLTHAVVQAYHNFMPPGQYPVAALLIEMDPAEVDVNVHPAKTQVRFRQADAVFSAVQKAVRRALLAEAEPPRASDDLLWASPDFQARRERLTQVTGQRMSQFGLGLEFSEAGYQPRAEMTAPESASAPPVRQRKLPLMRLIGQVGSTYLVAEGPSGLYLIDQHAAHHRILFEQVYARLQAAEMPVQELLEAAVLELMPEQMSLFETNQDALLEAGFRVESFGRNTVQLRAVPALLASVDPMEALLGTLGLYDEEAGSAPRPPQEILAVRLSRQAAIKAGQTLSQAEMLALMRELEHCEQPQADPLGNPTLIHISAEQLAREFGRQRP